MLEEKIKNLIKEKFGSVRQFAFSIGIPYTTVDTILKRGIDNSNVGNVIKMCKALNISIDNLLDNKDILFNLNFDNATPTTLDYDTVKIPVLGKIPAGMPFEAIEEEYTVDYEEIPREWMKGGKEYFALKIDGDSMEPNFKDKDTVVFLKSPTCESGQYCCVKVNGYDATFKKVQIQENGILLSPLNENNSTGYKATFYTKEQIEKLPVEIIGIAKRYIGDL